jgi:hypothetical protein
MNSKTLPRDRVWLVASLATAMALGPTPAAGQEAEDPAGGDDPKQVCLQSFDRGQTRRTEGRLLAARQDLAVCAQSRCPDFVRPKCIAWMQELDAAIPSVVVSAKAPSGQDTTAVRVLLDGKVVAETLDGKPIQLDPGPHQLVLEHGGVAPVEMGLLAKQGEQNRIIEVSFATPSASSEKPATSATEPEAPKAPGGEGQDQGGISPLVWVGLGLGVAGLGVGAVTGGLAMASYGDLEERCPDGKCVRADTEEDYDATGALADVSTVAFIAGGVLTAAGVIGLVISLAGSEEEEGAAWTLQPTFGPGFAGLVGSF